MGNQLLSSRDKQDIRAAVLEHGGAIIDELASSYGVHRSTIYTVTKDVRTIQKDRKPRSDKGKRKTPLLDGGALEFAAGLVARQNVAPEYALDTADANSGLFGEVKVSTGTFRRYLYEHGVSRKQSKLKLVTHRRFEAEYPGQMFQFDISGLKERWVDENTRRIYKIDPLEVSRNHPSRRADRINLWKFVIIDDYSRFKFVRFVACRRPNTVHVARFLREAFESMGVPMRVYTDKDAVIHNHRMRRGASILNAVFADSGGFELTHHEAGNPNATGKVERTHQIVEEFEKLIGVQTTFGNVVDVEGLNKFADWFLKKSNSRIHSSTGVAPRLRFRETTNPKRMVDPVAFEAAFAARDLECKVNSDVTITVDGTRWQLSRKAADPFLELAAQGKAKLQVYWIDDAPFFSVITPAGDEYHVAKVEARADAADEFKQLPETKAEQTMKRLEASQKELKEKAREAKKETGEDLIRVPGFGADVVAEPGIAEFPRREEQGDTATLDRMTHYIASALYTDQIDQWDALAVMQREGLAPSEPCEELAECKAWLKSLFAGREQIGETELREALQNRSVEPETETEVSEITYLRAV